MKRKIYRQMHFCWRDQGDERQLSVRRMDITNGNSCLGANIYDLMKNTDCNRNFIENYVTKKENGQRKAYFKGDLDHYYSKEEIPALALSFFNLVPSCKVCNHEKSDSIKRIFYPYYDNEDNDYHFSAEIFADEKQIAETLYSYSDSEGYMHNRPLSKLTKDILLQIGVGIEHL